MSLAFKIAVLVLALVVGYECVSFFLLFRRASAVVDESSVYERIIPDAQQRILVAGDSTAAGTGAKDSADSIAGRLGRDFPNSNVRNIGANGLKIAGLREKLAALSQDERYDLILLQIGGNDILRFTPRGAFRRELVEALEEAKKRSERVVLMSTGDVGLAPAFSPFFPWFYSMRTRAVRELLIQTAQEQNVIYIDLFEEKENDPFLKDPKKFYAPDGLHPSGEGYGLWYQKLRAVLVSEGILN